MTMRIMKDLVNSTYTVTCTVDDDTTAAQTVTIGSVDFTVYVAPRT